MIICTRNPYSSNTLRKKRSLISDRITRIILSSGINAKESSIPISLNKKMMIKMTNCMKSQLFQPVVK